MVEPTTIEPLPPTTEQLYGEIPILLRSTTFEPPPTLTEQLDGEIPITILTTVIYLKTYNKLKLVQDSTPRGKLCF